MKKALAIFLSALLICISVAPMAVAVSGPALTNKVIEGQYSKDAAGAPAITTTTFTVVVTAPAVEKLTGFNMYFEYDPSILAVKSAGLAGADAESTNFPGMIVNGPKQGVDNQYALAWIPSSGSGISKAQSRDLIYITFNVIDTTKDSTPLYLYIDEFITEDGDDENDIKSTVLYANQVINFDYPENTPPATITPDEGDGAEEGDTTAADINQLLQLIRDMLNGNGVTFGDFADAIENVLGNAEITDMLEMLVDGEVDIVDAFSEFLKAIGLDFGSLEDILNKVIEFFSGLFGGDDDNTGAEQTTAAASNTATTAAGSSTGSEKTGDKGVALAATVCVISTAAFVLTRKKKEII